MPQHSPRPRSFSRFASAALAAAALALAGLLAAAPASAHDELVGTDPAVDAALERSPEQLTLTFSANISDAPGASVVEVTDATGAVDVGALVTTDNVLIVPLEGEASGAVTVLWKVVSSDGHPISGQYGFTVTAAPTPTDSPEPTPTATATTPVETASPSATPEPVADEDSTFADVWPWVVGGFLLAGAGGAIVYLLVTRARQQKALADARAKGPGDGNEPSAGR